MISSSGTGIILPMRTMPRIELSGKELVVKIIHVHADEGNVIVEYPDGYQRHHQAQDITSLLGFISNQLKNRYNLESFDIIPSTNQLTHEIVILVKDITYGS